MLAFLLFGFPDLPAIGIAVVIVIFVIVVIVIVVIAVVVVFIVVVVVVNDGTHVAYSINCSPPFHLILFLF